MPPVISTVDLFCGTGGLSLGLKQAGIDISAGIDVEGRCEYPYRKNIGAEFIHESVTALTSGQLQSLWTPGSLRLLAGCAPCQPFSSQRRGSDPSKDKNWPLLRSFARLVEQTRPELVTMENVPRLQSNEMFAEFTTRLEEAGYSVAYSVLYGPDFGLAQHRKRLILLASRLGAIELPTPTHTPNQYVTVQQVIGGLRPLNHGQHDPRDPLHFARHLSALNLKRARASRPGGTWKDWPQELLAPCQKRDTAAAFANFYGRMRPDAPAPTITTQPYNTGAGRFTHYSQDRGLTLREAALLQGFPSSYVFTAPEDPIRLAPVGKLIGNAVPPPFGRAIGIAIHEHLRKTPSPGQPPQERQVP